MDNTTAQLAAFAGGMRYENLPAEVIHEAKRRLLDTLGCAIGGYDSPPGHISRSLAAGSRPAEGARGARVLGLEAATVPDLAAFANAAMVRYLDFNDSFASARASGGHPSDMIPAVLAVADAAGASGRAALLGVVAAYQANAAVPVPFKKLGWDQGVMTGIGAAVGAGVALGLDPGVIGNAISLTVTQTVPLRVTRSGELSMWKGCATAAAGRGAVFATQLAASGMTGPDEPFEGRHGLWEQATGPFSLELDPAAHGWRILDADTKLFPVEGGAQAVLPALLDLASGLSLDDIEAIHVRTYWGLWFEAASEPAKWDPQTRETADHSLPYVMAVALRDGGITLASFRDDVIRDPALRPLMARITVAEDPELTGNDPTLLAPSEIRIRTRSGEERSTMTTAARGNHANPMTDDELAQKFLGLATLHADRARSEALLEAILGIEAAKDVGPTVAQWASVVLPA